MYANMLLNLDASFNPFPKSPIVAFESFTFSGGEPHIKISTDLTNVDTIQISHRINSFNDFGLLLIAVDAVKRMDVKDIEVFIPYFPAARQDRVMVKGEALSVKVYAEILNALGLSRITIYDPHSEVAPALLDNCRVIENHTLVAQIIQSLPKNTLLISPDGGALKKIYKVAAYLKDYAVVECGKSRDVSTGKLSGFKVNTDDLENRPCLIVDDICDGGGTFIGLAKELKQKNCGPLFLVVSHGIFNRGTDELEKVFDKIFTTDSIKDWSGNSAIDQIDISHLI